MNNSARRVALPETSQMIQSKHKLISSLAGFHHIALAPSDSPLALQFAVNMDSIDGTEHYERASDEPPPSLLTVILDTNPHAWALLADTLSLSKALANILVFINAHLALNYANKVAVIASHTQRAEFLYPSQTPSSTSQATNDEGQDGDLYNDDSDVEMLDGPSDTAPPPQKKKSKSNLNGTHPSLPRSNTKHATDDANKYRPFRLISEALFASLSSLLLTTTASSLTATPTTSIAGALTLALTYINKQTLASSLSGPSAGQTNPNVRDTDLDDKRVATTLQSRILILSVSGDLAAQYIPLMNCIFASQRLSIPIDICKVAGDTVFLQQASDATQGIYIKLEAPQGLLQYLMMGFLPDQGARRWLVGTGAGGVDLRAACFCHRRVVGLGWVCSVCLSIFCEPPPDANCLTCGTHLSLAEFGGRPAVGGRRGKKKKRKGGAGTPGLG